MRIYTYQAKFHIVVYFDAQTNSRSVCSFLLFAHFMECFSLIHSHFHKNGNYGEKNIKCLTLEIKLTHRGGISGIRSECAFYCIFPCFTAVGKTSQQQQKK